MFQGNYLRPVAYLRPEFPVYPVETQWHLSQHSIVGLNVSCLNF